MMIAQRIYHWLSFSRVSERATSILAGAMLVGFDDATAKYLLWLGISVWIGCAVVLDRVVQREAP